MCLKMLLRQIYYGLSITTYLDRAVSDEDRHKAIQSLYQLFQSMAVVTARVMLNSITMIRGLYLKDTSSRIKQLKIGYCVSLQLA